MSHAEIQCDEHLKCATIEKDQDHFQTQRSLPNWLEQCNCSANCNQFGDCCEDSPQVVNEDLSQWQMQVVNVNTGFRYFTLIKAKCGKDWKKRKVRDQCEMTGVSEATEYLRSGLSNYLSLIDDEFLVWQVTSKETLITYKNIYCAICNNDAENLESWSLNLKCIRDDLPGKCGQAFHPIPPSFLIKEKVRRKPVIQPQIFTGCNSVWIKANVRHDTLKTVNIIKNCARIYAPVVFQDATNQQRIIFKNEYCAICNDFDKSKLLCPSKSNDSYKLSFPYLYDTEASYDTEFAKGGLYLNSTSKRCPVNSVYDPFKESCRSLVEEDESEEQATSEMSNEIAVESSSSSEQENRVDEQSLLAQEQMHSNRASQRIVEHYLYICAFTSFALFYSSCSH